MSGPVPVWLDPAAQAGALAALLGRLGLAAEVVEDQAGTAGPCVAVSGFAAGGTVHGYVHAAQDQFGVWRWWLALPGGAGLAAGAPLCEVSSTADAVVRALARAAQGGPLTAVPGTRPGRPALAAADEARKEPLAMSQAGAPAATLVFPGELRRVQDARRWAAALLAQVGADPKDAGLLTAELVTNALLHTRSGGRDGTVTVAVTQAGVLHVHDLGPAEGSCAGPDGWVPAADREDFGNGLLLVATLSTELVHGPAADCPLNGPGAPATAGGCCTQCVPLAAEAAPAGAAPARAPAAKRARPVPQPEPEM